MELLGTRLRLYAPCAPHYGKCHVLVDNRDCLSVELYGRIEEPSSIVVEQRLPAGFHAVVIRPAQGVLACDCLEVLF